MKGRLSWSSVCGQSNQSAFHHQVTQGEEYPYYYFNYRCVCGKRYDKYIDFDKHIKKMSKVENA